VNRETRIGVALVAGLGAFVFLLLVVGSLGEARPDVDPLTVDEALSDGPPADRWASDELHVVGWYAELDADCDGDEGGADATVAWLQRECPLRVLLQEQPDDDVTHAELLRDGIVLAAPVANVFPSRAQPGGPNLRGQPLVFVGHFADDAAERCVPERLERCRNSFVVVDYDGFFR
jgi:hypothetical protein